MWTGWKSKFKIWYLLLILVFFTVLLFYQKDLFGFLTAGEMAGRDLAGNYGFARLMSNLISRGRITGWSNIWFAGFPAFEFYPPFFFLLVNSLAPVLSLEMSFRIVVFLSVFAFPFVVFFTLLKMGLSSRAVFTGSFFSLAFLFMNQHLSAVSRTFNMGLVTQMLALNLLFLSMAFLNSLKNRTETVAAGLLLGLTALTHPFVSLFAALGWIVCFAVKKNRERVLWSGMIALLISSGWWLNALRNFEFMTSYVSGFRWYSFPLFTIPFILLSFRKLKKVNWLLASLLASLMVYGLDVPQLQPSRFFFYSLPFAYVLAGVGFSELYDLLTRVLGGYDPRLHKTAAVVLVLVVFVPLTYGLLQTNVSSMWETDLNIDEVVSALEGLEDGRVLLQPFASSKERYVLPSVIPFETGNPVLNELHVDSSVSSPYTLLVRDMVFEGEVRNPVCKLCFEEVPEEILPELLDRYNIRYAVAMDDSLTHPDLFRLVKETDSYRVYKRNETGPMYEVLDREPIGVRTEPLQWKLLNDEILWEGITDMDIVRIEEDEESPFEENIDLRETEVEEAVEELKDMEPPDTEDEASVKEFSYTDEEITLDIDSEGKVPVLLKFSYYPKWNCKGCEVYWTNPSVMVVYGKGRTELRYSSPGL